MGQASVVIEVEFVSVSWFLGEVLSVGCLLGRTVKYVKNPPS